MVAKGVGVAMVEDARWWRVSGSGGGDRRTVSS